MTEKYTITRMTPDEMPWAIDWANAEGWNPGRHDANCFYRADPKGFFIGKLGDEPVAVGSAVCYDDAFAFCGLYMVKPEYRDHGYGLALTKARLAYIGHRNAGLDGVMTMLDHYERLGYQTAHNNVRYESPAGFKVAPIEQVTVTPLANLPLATLLDYDRRHFPAPRPAFLECWINQPESLALGVVNEGELLGYGVIRSCQTAFKLAPLFADSFDIAEALMSHLAQHAKGAQFTLDIPMNNPHALRLVESFGFKPVFETARMYLKGIPDIKHHQVYGITSLELG